MDLLDIAVEAADLELRLSANKPYANSTKNKLIAKAIIESAIGFIDANMSESSYDEIRDYILKSLQFRIDI